MKSKKTNFKVAVFAVACIALSATAINAAQPFIGTNNPVSNYVYAAEGQSIKGLVVAGSIKTHDTPMGAVHNIPLAEISFSVPEAAKYNAGDYIEFTTENLSLNANGREVRINDRIVAKMVQVESVGGLNNKGNNPNNPGFQSLRPEDSGYNTKQRIVFTEGIKDVVGTAKISIESVNVYQGAVPASRDYNIISKLLYDGKTVAQGTTRIAGIKTGNITTPQVNNGFVYSNTKDGENITIDGMNMWIRSEESVRTPIAVGDIFEHRIGEESGVAFDNESMLGRRIISKNGEAYSAENPQGALYVNTEDFIEVEVIEASPRSMRYRVVTPPKSKNFNAPVFYQKMKLLDTSPNTIDYDNQKIKAIPFTAIYESVNPENSRQYSFNLGSDISGAQLKAYAQIRKRGSIIRQIQDEKGNKIPGFESDKLILERVQEGTPYNVEAPQIEGLVFKRLDANSAPQNGVVKEGVQNVILVYGKPELPKEEPKIEETPEIKAPDTGSEYQGIFVAILSGISTMTVLTAIFFRKK